MNELDLDPRLPRIQNADLEDKVVLVRVDHNVVKNGFQWQSKSNIISMFAAMSIPVKRLGAS